MANITIDENPIVAAVKSASHEIEIDGEGGRKFLLKRPTPIMLVWNLPELTQNAYQLMAGENALWVAKIDGETLPLPTSALQLKERVQRIMGESGDGLTIVQVAREALFGDGGETLEDKRERIRKKLQSSAE